jgi:alanine racemase
LKQTQGLSGFTPTGSFETWAEINLDNITHNIRQLREYLGKTEIMAVLKSNAYGLHAPMIFRHLRELGIRYFAVANVREALQLRNIDADASILILGNVHPRFMSKAIENNLAITVFSQEFWQILKTYLSGPLSVHIKLNTGLNRLGFSCDKESVSIIKEICTHPMIRCEGIFSHLALVSTENDRAQFDSFRSMVSMLEAEGLSFPIKHIADSIGVATHPWSHLDLVRTGAVMYGLKARYSGYEKLNLKGAFTFKSSVAQIRTVPKGGGVSYDYAYRAPHDVKTATLAFGYVDGYPRNLGHGKGFVIIRGHKAPIIGVMCMDQCIVDASNVPDIQINDEVLIYETDESSPVSALAVAELAGTNKNSLFCSLAMRVPRIYIKNGKSFALDILSGNIEELKE